MSDAYTMKAQMRRILYRLKRQYGYRMWLYKVETDSNNVQTGEITRTYEVYEIRKGIVLPKRLTRKFAYDLTYLAANKNFQYGAYYDLGIRDIIIETKDLPNNLQPDLRWHIIFDHKRFELREINFYDQRLAMYIQAHETTHQLPFEWHNKAVETQIDFFEQSSGVKS